MASRRLAGASRRKKEPVKPGSRSRDARSIPPTLALSPTTLDIGKLHKSDLLVEHERSLRNLRFLRTLRRVGCFYCCQTFPPSEIREAVGEEQTAICPRCGIDSVTGRCDRDFLRRMHRYWFERGTPLGLRYGRIYIEYYLENRPEPWLATVEDYRPPDDGSGLLQPPHGHGRTAMSAFKRALEEVRAIERSASEQPQARRARRTGGL